jgi:hypothetical protein
VDTALGSGIEIDTGACLHGNAVGPRQVQNFLHALVLSARQDGEPNDSLRTTFQQGAD